MQVQQQQQAQAQEQQQQQVQVQQAQAQALSYQSQRQQSPTHPTPALSQEANTMTPRRLRARMIEKPPAAPTDSYEELVGKAEARLDAKAARAEPAGESGLLSFMGASQGAVERTLRAAARKAAEDWTAAGAAEREAQEAAKAMRAAAAAAATTPWDAAWEDADGEPASREGRPFEAAAAAAQQRVDLRAVEDAEGKIFQRIEARKAAKVADPELDERGGRIVGLVKELDQPRVVRDFDAEIAALLSDANARAA